MKTPREMPRYRRLTFVRAAIEPLEAEDLLRWATADGIYEMTKKEFETTFANVVQSGVYCEGKPYSCKQTPKKAERYRIGAAPPRAPRGHSRKEYALPDELKGECSEAAYGKWLHRKAVAHVKRDGKRWKRPLSISDYKKAIHTAVCRTTKCDAYTGEDMD
jgi:hypothetical protein